MRPLKISSQDPQSASCGGILDSFGTAFQEAIDAVAETIEDVGSLIDEIGLMSVNNNRTVAKRLTQKTAIIAYAPHKNYTLKVPPKSNISPSQLAQLAKSQPGIRTIVLDGNSLTSEHLAALQQFKALDSLSLVNCQLKDSDLLALRGLESLRTLNLSANPQVKGTLFDKALPQSLANLSCDACDLSDEAMAKCKHLHGLIYASFAANSRLTGQRLIALPKTLRELNLNYCAVQDEHLAQLMFHLNLRTLCVTNNPQVTGKHFYFLESLETLNCSNCPISSTDFPTKLQKLLHTMQFTEAQAEALVKRCPKLKEAVLDSYSNEKVIRDHFGTTGNNLVVAFQKRLQAAFKDPNIKIVLIPNTHYFTILHSEKYALDDCKKVLEGVPSYLEDGSGWKITQLQECNKGANKLFKLLSVCGGRSYEWIQTCDAIKESSPLFKTAMLTNLVFQMVMNPCPYISTKVMTRFQKDFLPLSLNYSF